MDATIIVKRKSSYIAILRPFTVKVDGTKMATVKNGQECKFLVTPGQHQIEVVGALWARSQTISMEANDGQTVSFECGVMNKHVLPIFFFALTLIPIRIFERDILGQSPALVIFALLVLLAFVGYALVVSFRRNMMYYLKKTPDNA